MTRPAQSTRLILVVAVVVAVVGALALSQLLGKPSGSDTPGSPGIAVASGERPTGPGATGSDGSTPGAAPTTGPDGTVPTPEGSGRPVGSRFPGGLLIADRLNGRLIVVDDAGKVLWRFPVAGSLPAGEKFSADDAFVSPDGKTIVANEEENQVIVRIDIATRKVIWEYGTFGNPGRGPGQLWNPDDAYPLANGDITVADILNCRIIQIAPSKEIVRQWGKTGQCGHNPPKTYAQPNGDTPLPDGGMLITEILAKRVVRLSADGRVLFDVRVPLNYPSDAQLLPNGNVLVVDYWNPGTLIVVNPTTGNLVYRFGPTTGQGKLNHPSLAVALPDGTFIVNDDRRHRVVVIDPVADRIVWTYGHTGKAGTADGYLNTPDGVDLPRLGIFN